MKAFLKKMANDFDQMSAKDKKHCEALLCSIMFMLSFLASIFVEKNILWVTTFLFLIAMVYLWSSYFNQRR